MSAESYRWIDTNRRTDAEILSEIAGGEEAFLVLYRGEPLERRFESFLHHMAQTKDSVDIVLAAVPGDHLLWGYFHGWPTPMVLLVQSPMLSSFIMITTEKSRNRSAQMASSLWDWVIRHQAAGGRVFPVVLDTEPDAYPPLRDPVRHRLVPADAPRLAPDFSRNIHQFAGLKLAESPDATALRAGLFQWHDALDESHECSQSIEGQGRHRAGDYWHAIMHRREPDYGNSKYWFRRVGSHLIFPELARRAESIITVSLPDWKDRLLRNGWDPFAFADLCEVVAGKNQPEREAAAEAIQEIEMLLLLGSTYQDATSW